jgi:hypothetical protein
MKSFFALVTPFDPGAHPDHELPKPPTGPRPPTGGQPPRPDHTLPGELPKPEHPIFWPLPPGAPVDPDYGIPEGGAGGGGGQPPRPDQGLPPRPDQGLPQPPTGGVPPTGGQPPRPDHTLPGDLPKPEHPIVLPPDSGGWDPVFIWGPTDPRPTPPIEIPPDGTTEDGAEIKFKAIWTPTNGWQTIGVLVPAENGKPHPTPSAKK